jgi:hypothetical protein
MLRYRHKQEVTVLLTYEQGRAVIVWQSTFRFFVTGCRSDTEDGGHISAKIDC